MDTTVAVRPAVKLVLDTDMDSDVDDAGALAVLHALARRGEVQILAVMVSGLNRYSPGCVDAINTFHGRPDLPIGQAKGVGVDSPSRYARQISQEYPNDVDPDAIPDALDLYRETLAGQGDGEVVITTVGDLTNLENLLKSGPDAHSPLSGLELVRRKVRRWVMMAGALPNVREERNCCNLGKAPPRTGVWTIRNWPGELTWVGYDDGVRTGGARIRDGSTSANPVRRAYQLFNDFAGRASSDLVAALYAVRGDGELFSRHQHGSSRLTPLGDPDAFDAGMRIEWVAETDDPRESFVRRRIDGARLAQILDGLILEAGRQPTERSTGRDGPRPESAVARGSLRLGDRGVSGR
jgi:hypothetical protein